MMRKVLVFILSISLFLTSCSNHEARSFNELKLDTICTLTLYSSRDERYVEGSFRVIDKYALMIDMYDENSELYHLNSNASNAPVKVSDELFDLISYALSVAKETNGAFNPAIAPLVKLWGIGSDSARVPRSEEIEEALKLTDYENIVLDSENKTVSFLKEGMAIDLGAVGKGYISDKVAEYLRSSGVENAIINLGGNVYVIGTRPDGEPWNVGIQAPGEAHGGYFTTVRVSDSAVITSGAYERYFEEDGILYHHILDSKTGHPAKSDILSSTVISPDGALSDMLTTACFVLGSGEAERLVNHYGVSAVFLLESGEEIRVGV